MNKISWIGVYPALLTPFKANDEVDYEVFEKNLNAQLEAGVDGVIVAGSLGEASTLSTAEKFEVLKFAIKAVDGKVPVVLNIAEPTTKEALVLAKGAEEIGAAGLMLLPPMRYKADDRETLTYMTTVAKSTTLPIMIYNNPVDYGIFINLDMFEELSKYDNVQAVKESTRDISNITRMKNRFGDRFKILCGVDPLAFESLAAGADGWVAGLVDAFPEETVTIYQLVKAGEYQAALDIYRWFLPLLELDIHPKLVQYIKLAAAATGIGTEYVRAPRLVLEGEEHARISKVISDALAVRPTLPDWKSKNVMA
jgi:1-pyrroline-4-hydroxy-2-carboxylate deaminase